MVPHCRAAMHGQRIARTTRREALQAFSGVAPSVFSVIARSVCDEANPDLPCCPRLLRFTRNDNLGQNRKGTKMGAAQNSAQAAQWVRWRGVADLYHSYFTGLILTVVTRRGTADAAEFVFRVVSPAAAGTLPAGLDETRLEPSAAGDCGGAVSLSVQLDRRRSCRIHERDRPQGLDPLSAAALDLEGHGDLRRAG
jgi:hypothetical protein